MSKKLHFFLAVMALLLSGGVNAQTDAEYQKALETIKDGNFYRVYTEVQETKYYLKADGTLTSTEEDAKDFEFKAVKATNTAYETGWNLGCKFSNPKMNPNSSDGAIVNSGSIVCENGNNRDDFERQVFFQHENGEYAVRATNAGGDAWGASAFWTVIDAKAGYTERNQPAYIWKLEDVTAQNLLASVKAVIDAKVGVGKAPFCVSESDYNTYVAAYEKAAAVINGESSTEEDIAQAVDELQAARAAYAAAPRNQPVDGKPYYIVNNTVEGNLCVGSDNITVEAGAKVCFTAVDGGYVISNTDGKYIFKTTDNNWTLATTEDMSQAYVLTVEIDAQGFTLKGAKGLLGLDSNDATIYANKTTANNAYWTAQIIETAYEGYIAEELSHPALGPIGNSEEKQTVTIEEPFNGTTNITFSGINTEMITTSEFTVENVSVTEEEDGSVSYSCESFDLVVKRGMMTTNYKVTLEGTKAADAESIPVITVTLNSGLILTAKFAATGSADRTIKIADTENGKVEASVEKAKAGETVTLTVTPDEGCVLEELTVTDANGDVVNVSDDYTFVMPISNVTVTATFVKETPVITGTVYEGYLAENGFHRAMNTSMGDYTEAQTVTIADPVDGVTSITFSGINFVGSLVPMPVAIPEFTIDNVIVTDNADGSVSYTCDDATVYAPRGNMAPAEYAATLVGTKASADATPVITITLTEQVILTAVFAATEEDAKDGLGTAVSINSVNSDAVKANGKYLEGCKVVIYRNGVKYGVNGAAVK
ncbi:MAG: hypothetical protein J1F40_04635 [Prevotellaceae bacterium]|nr:hypothetical protein [Prevotellaceae bacterium]